MDEALPSAAPPHPRSLTSFAPLAENQRIEALDVVRGFALLGIFLMNIEWFNRPFAAFNEGIPRTAAGVDWLCNFVVNYFVAGKFWTIFSLLFGMGFAVMLVRAERAGRLDFKHVYLRRILALAVFGALHYIFVWEGDILFSYAMGALGLLIVLYGRPWPIVIGCAALIGLGFIPRADLFFRLAGGLATMGLLALYLRSEKRIGWRGRSVPLSSFAFMAMGVALCIAAVVVWVLPAAPVGPRAPLAVLGPLLLIAGWLSWRFHRPAEKRSVRLAVSVYVFMALTMTLISGVQHMMPDPEAVLASTASKAPVDAAAEAELARAKEVKVEREKSLAEAATRKLDETRIFTTGRYGQAEDWRASRFVEKAANDGGFAVLLVSMFLLGTWFVRSGVMERPADHLPFFRKLALYGLPVGIGLGLLSSLIAVSHTPGDRHDGWGIAHGLLMLGNLPACLGYVGLVVTMLYSHGGGSRIRVLAPLGRMALTNYLMQSLVCATFFYGFGLGHWGWSRSAQVVFVAVVYAAQLAFSHWWLARFRYGPVEWLWRGFTYGQVPAMRITAAPAATAQAA